MSKTKLEEYLGFLASEAVENDHFIFDRKAFEKANGFDNPYRMNRFKIANFTFISALAFIPLAFFASEINDKHMLAVSLILMFAFFTASSIALAINKRPDWLESYWMEEEWKNSTGLEFIDDGMVSSPVSFAFTADETNFMERIHGKPEAYQRKMLRRVLALEGFLT